MNARFISVKPSLFERLFFSPGDQRLRAGWRVLITLLIIVVFLSGNMVLQDLSSNLAPTSFVARVLSGFPLFALLQSLIMMILVLLARIWIDRRSIASLGLALNRRTAADLIIGILSMGMVYALIYLLLLKAGWVQSNPVDWSSAAFANIASSLLMGFLLKIIGSWGEELVFRGYLLQNIKDGLSLFWAVVIPSFLFGIAHLANPNATLAGAAGITMAGLLLGYAYVRTRQLWLPIGIHIGNNFFQGVVFGFPVSGSFSFFHILQSNITGPDIITGGAFGPEAGLVILPFLFLIAGVIYFYTRGRIEIEK